MFIVDLLKSSAKKRLLNLIPDNAAVCEIGVWRGEFSNTILNELKPKELHLIDPWSFYPEYRKRWYGGAKAKNQKDMDNIYKGVKGAFSKKRNVHIYRMTSEKAAKRFVKDHFDLIYIDGNHSYQFVRKDLESYFSKLKKGGIIAGDDFFWREGLSFPVMRAVREFIAKHRLQYSLFFDNFVIKKV